MIIALTIALIIVTWYAINTRLMLRHLAKMFESQSAFTTTEHENLASRVYTLEETGNKKH